jgi:hypothetical protein
MFFIKQKSVLFDTRNITDGFYLVNIVTPVDLENGEEIQICLEYTYLGTKVDKSGNQNIEINHRITQALEAIHTLKSIWWNIHVTENRKFVHMKH